jgi:hypothetical protein
MAVTKTSDAEERLLAALTAFEERITRLEHAVGVLAAIMHGVQGSRGLGRMPALRELLLEHEQAGRYPSPFGPNAA